MEVDPPVENISNAAKTVSTEIGAYSNPHNSECELTFEGLECTDEIPNNQVNSKENELGEFVDQLDFSKDGVDELLFNKFIEPMNPKFGEISRIYNEKSLQGIKHTLMVRQ